MLVSKQIAIKRRELATALSVKAKRRCFVKALRESIPKGLRALIGGSVKGGGIAASAALAKIFR